MKFKNYSLIAFLLALFALYAIVCFYALPFADDFCYGWTASQKISFAQKFLNQYLFWNGRYTSDVLVNFHPLVTGKIFLYQLALFASLLATPVVVFAFVHQLLKNKMASFIASFFIALFYLNYLPDITEGVYWFIGIANYHLGNLFVILQLFFLIKFFEADRRRKNFLQIISLTLLIISVGFNEVAAMLIPVFYFCLLIFENNRRKFFALHFIVAIVASAFVIFSPGNSVRAANFPERYNFFHSLLYASLQTVRFIFVWIFSVPFVLLSVVVVSLSNKFQNNFIRKIDYRIVFGFLVFTVFIGSFLPYFATGILGQHRTINYVFFYFIFLWMIFLISVSKKFELHKKFAWQKNERVISALLFASIFSLAISGNSRKTISDFKNNNFRKYENAFVARQSKILENVELPIQPLNAIPQTFQITDAKADTAWWADKCMKNFYRETNLKLY